MFVNDARYRWKVSPPPRANLTSDHLDVKDPAANEGLLESVDKSLRYAEELCAALCVVHAEPHGKRRDGGEHAAQVVTRQFSPNRSAEQVDSRSKHHLDLWTLIQNAGEYSDVGHS